jgi:hypothetical protein
LMIPLITVSLQTLSYCIAINRLILSSVPG